MANVFDSVVEELRSRGITQEELVAPIRDLVQDIHNSEDWQHLSSDAFKELLHKAITYYGMTSLESLVPFIFPMYQHAIDFLTVSDRLELESKVREQMENRTVSGNGLMPFIYADDNRAVVSSATIDLAMIPAPFDENPIYWPQNILKDLVMGMGQCKGGILGGLICLGDHRVNQLIESVWDVLEDDDIKEAALCRSSWASLGAFDVWMNYGETLANEGKTESSRFGHVMSALVLLCRAAKEGVFQDVQRNFGYLFNESTQLRSLDLLGEYSLEDVLKKYEERLTWIAELEQEPKLALDVLKALRGESIVPLA
jgi:hypothetical protein